MVAQTGRDEVTRITLKLYEYNRDNNPYLSFSPIYEHHSKLPSANLSTQEEIEQLVKPYLERDDKPPFSVGQLMVTAALAMTYDRGAPLIDAMFVV